MLFCGARFFFPFKREPVVFRPSLPISLSQLSGKLAERSSGVGSGEDW